MADQITLAAAVNLTGRVFTLDTSSPTFDELRSTGQLRLIRNSDLKRAIAEYYRAVEGSHFVDGHQEHVIWEEYHGLLSSHGIAAFDVTISEAEDLASRLRRVPNLAAMVRRARAVFSVQDRYTYPLQAQAAQLLANLREEVANR